MTAAQKAGAEKKARVAALRNVIDNHARQGKAGEPASLRAMEEHGRLTTGGLEFRRTLGLIVAAAKAGTFVSYKEVALESGLAWSRAAMGQVSKHLDAFSTWAHESGLPMLTAVVVRHEDRESGAMDGTALEGFAACGERLGVTGALPEEDRAGFLAAQRARIKAFSDSGRLDRFLAEGEG